MGYTSEGMDTSESEEFYRIDPITGELHYDVVYYSFENIKIGFLVVWVLIFLPSLLMNIRDVVDFFVQMRLLNRHSHKWDIQFLQEIVW